MMSNRPVKSDYSIAVLGAGAWGTALAAHLGRCQHAVRLWGYCTQTISPYNKDLSRFPERALPPAVTVYTDLKAAMAGANDILIAVPSKGFRDLMQQVEAFWSLEQGIIWATKGLDLSVQPARFLDELVEEVLGPCKMAVLSGPSFAKEVAQTLPTAVVVASKAISFAEQVASRFRSDTFRVFCDNDMRGVQLGGVVKNIAAVAAGVIDGVGLGVNARSAVITYSLLEMQRLGVALGAKAQTFIGLAGLGDLALTATSPLSRNYRLGIALGQKRRVSEARAAVSGLVESIDNIQAVRLLASSLDVFMPVTQSVCEILEGKITPKAAIMKLWTQEAVNLC